MLFFLTNQLPLSKRERIVDHYLPLKINIVERLTYFQIFQDYLTDNFSKLNEEVEFKRKYIFIKTESLLQIKISLITGEIFSLTLMIRKSVAQIDRILNIDTFPRINRTLAISTQEVLDEYDYDINREPIVEIFKNAIVVIIDQTIKPCFLIYENSDIGMLVDEDLYVSAFITWNLSQDEIAELNESIKGRQAEILKTGSFFDQNKCSEKYLRSNKEDLIEKILELKNINHWNVLYYGYHKFLINKQFLIDFTMKFMTQKNTNNSIVEELASLPEQEHAKIYNLLDKLIDSKEEIMEKQKELYDKIWFYLTFASEMKGLDLIS